MSRRVVMLQGELRRKTTEGKSLELWYNLTHENGAHIKKFLTHCEARFPDAFKRKKLEGGTNFESNAVFLERTKSIICSPLYKNIRNDLQK